MFHFFILKIKFPFSVGASEGEIIYAKNNVGLSRVNVFFKEYDGKYYCQYNNGEVFEFGNVRSKLEVLDEYSKYFGVFLEGDGIMGKVTNNTEYTKTQANGIDIYYTDINYLGQKENVEIECYWYTSDSKLLYLDGFYDSTYGICGGYICNRYNEFEGYINSYIHINAILFDEYIFYYNEDYLCKRDIKNSDDVATIDYKTLLNYNLEKNAYIIKREDRLLVQLPPTPLFVDSNYIKEIIPLDYYITGYSDYYDINIRNAGINNNIIHKIEATKTRKDINSVLFTNNALRYSTDKITIKLRTYKIDIAYLKEANLYKCGWENNLIDENTLSDMLITHLRMALINAGFHNGKTILVNLLSNKTIVKSLVGELK